MSTPEERSAKALIAIAGYLKDLVPIMATINENVAEFAKIVRDQHKEEGEQCRTTNET